MSFQQHTVSVRNGLFNISLRQAGKDLQRTTIEDLAGNNIGKSFEVDLFEGVQRRLTNSTVKLPFEVRGP